MHGYARYAFEYGQVTFHVYYICMKNLLCVLGRHREAEDGQGQEEDPGPEGQGEGRGSGQGQG
jgi:hypothetical protein